MRRPVGTAARRGGRRMLVAACGIGLCWAVFWVLIPAAEVVVAPRAVMDVDRFEGEWAVLITEDGVSVPLPRSALPEAVQAGDVVVLEVRRKAEASARLKAEVQRIQRLLSEGDPGGNVQP